MLSCISGCVGRAGPTSSRVSMADPGVVAAVLTVVLGAVPDELTESISPATSWISRAKMAKSLARSWLILRTQGNNLLTIRRGSLGLGINSHMNTWNLHTQNSIYKTVKPLKLSFTQCGSVPGYLLAVCCPVPDVLLLLFHAVFDPHSTWACHPNWAHSGAESGVAVWDDVMRPHVGPFRRIAIGAELFLRGGTVLWWQTSPPAAAGHYDRSAWEMSSFSQKYCIYSFPISVIHKTDKCACEVETLCFWGSQQPILLWSDKIWMLSRGEWMLPCLLTNTDISQRQRR